MKVKVHWIVDGIADVEAESQEEAESWVSENLQTLLNNNPEFKDKLGVYKSMDHGDPKRRKAYYVTDDENMEIYEKLTGGDIGEQPIGQLVGKDKTPHFY